MTPQQVVKVYGGGNVAVAAERLGISRQGLYLWIQKGRVPPVWQLFIEKHGLGGLKANIKRSNHRRGESIIAA